MIFSVKSIIYCSINSKRKESAWENMWPGDVLKASFLRHRFDILSITFKCGDTFPVHCKGATFQDRKQNLYSFLFTLPIQKYFDPLMLLELVFMSRQIIFIVCAW